MTTVDDIVASLPLQDLAERLDLTDVAIRQAVQLAVPALMGAMQANAESEPGAASLSEALRQHGSEFTEDEVSLDAIDPAEGALIVKNLLGDQVADVSTRLGRMPGDAERPAFEQLLPLLAPVVISHLSRATGGGDPEQLGKKLAELANGSSTGMRIQNMLGDLLGGGRR